MNKLFLFFICFLLVPFQALGETTVQATVDRTVISPDESLSLQVTITDGSGDVDTSGITDFDIASTGSGSNISLINGSMSRSRTFTYTLVPHSGGTLTIPALPVDTGDTTLHTKPIRITVTKGQTTSTQSGTAPVSVTASLSSEKAYVGQQLIYTVSVSQGVNMASAQLEPPDFTGFTAEKLEDQKSFDTVKNGQSFRVTQVMYLLTPLEAGTRTVGAATLSCDLIRQSRRRSRLDSFFGSDPFFSSQRRVHKVFRSRPLTLDILPLPAGTGTKQPFSGLIGRFSITADLDKTTLKTGESATLTVTISGTGNIQDAGQPRLSLPADCKVYPDEPVTTSQVSTAGTSGKKTFAFALVPTKTGALTLPSLALNWFDPRTGTFETASTRPCQLTITQGAAQPVPAPVQAAATATAQNASKTIKRDVTLLHKDILPLYDDVDAVTDTAPLSARSFLTLLFLPPFFFGCALLGRKKLRSSDHPSKKYARRATALIKEARNGPREEICTLCFKALITAVASRTHSLSESLTYDEAEAEILRTRGNQDLADRTRRLMVSLDTARYGAAGNAPDTTATLLEQTATIVRELCA